MEYKIIDWTGWEYKDLEITLNNLADEGWTPCFAINDHLILLVHARRPIKVRDGHVWAKMEETVHPISDYHWQP